MSKAENYNSSILDDILDDISPKEMKKVEKRMLLATKISDGIKAKGWKKIDFAKALSKRPSEITKWLSGTHNFNSDTLFDIEDVLDIELVATEKQEKEQVIFFNQFVSQGQIITKSDISVLEGENTYISLGKSFYHLAISKSDLTNCEYQA